MLLITCPHCGPRDEIEFRCAGQSHISRPGPAETVSDDEWGGYLYDRLNPKGTHYERWIHAMGCRRWFNIARHTATHDVQAIYAMGASKPSIFEGESGE